CDEGVVMGLPWKPGRGGREARRSGRTYGERARKRRERFTAEVLEDRRLLAITTTTPVPFSVAETVAYNGPVMNFTANDPTPQNPANYTATITWGDSTSTAATSITPLAGGGFAGNGSHAYAGNGTDTGARSI